MTYAEEMRKRHNKQYTGWKKSITTKKSIVELVEEAKQNGTLTELKEQLNPSITEQK